MKSIVQGMFPLVAATMLIACGNRSMNPAGTVPPKNGSIRDTDLKSLREPVSLAEMERRFGVAEEHFGPSVSYKAADHSGKYLWVSYFRPQTATQPPMSAIIVHDIALGTSDFGDAKTVWPKRWAALPREQASKDLSRLYNEAVAERISNKSLLPTGKSPTTTNSKHLSSPAAE
jgi:hypothetical protein